MAQVNPLTREVLIKLVYYGPGLCGKTTSLQKIHAASPPETRGKIVSLATPVDRTLYFDFMPLRVGPVHGYPVRLQLFTVPGQVYFNATRKLVLTNADGVVFVADSQRERQDANLESLQNLAANLAEQERSLDAVPHVLQYNKRDLSNILSVAELDEGLNEFRVPSFESSAARGLGVLDPLDELVRLVLLDLEKRAVFGGDSSGSETPRFEQAQDVLSESVSRASEEWHMSSAEQQPLRAASGLPSLPPVRMREPEHERVTEVDLVHNVQERARETHVVERSLMPPRNSALPRPIASHTIPAPAPVPLPTLRTPAPARLQSLEPPRPPQFDAVSHVPPKSTGLTWSLLFARHQGPQVAQLESDLEIGDFRSAIMRCDALAAEILADAAELHGLEQEERKPLLVALSLGLPAERWRSLRAVVQRARQGAELSELEALEAYTTLIEINRLHRSASPSLD
ncbi:MAG: ADP-ribosylation factor-like protein [Myxococcales bacterium]